MKLSWNFQRGWVFNPKTIAWGGRNIVWNNTFYYYWGKEYGLL